MASRADRRERLRQRMQNDSANRDKGGRNYRPLFDYSNYDDVNKFKAKSGKNEIDILPFEVTTKNDPMGANIGDDNYKLEYWRHNNIGPNNDMVLCLKETYGKACPICEEKQLMLDGGADWKDKEVDALHSKRRCIYNIIDLNDTEKHVQLFDQSHAWFEKELFGAAEYKDPAFIFFADIEEGYTVTFRGSEGTYNKKKFIEPKDFDFETRDPYDENIYDDVYPLDALLIVPSYEEVQNLFMGVDGEEEEKEEPKKETKSKSRKKKAEPKKEEKPVSRRKRSKKEEPKQEPEEDLTGCPHALEHGLIKGTDWDNHDVCKECEEEMYNECGVIFDDLEKLAEERKKKEEAEEKPSTRRRQRSKRS